MKFDVVALRRADEDVRRIVRWIAHRSLPGAISWLHAYEQMLDRLSTSADSCAAAVEDAECSLRLQQALFGTPHGQI